MAARPDRSAGQPAHVHRRREHPAGVVMTKASAPAEAAAQDRNELLKRVGAVFANVAVITALLVYFGWTRSEVQSKRLGIDESILGMSTRDYLLRSVGPVLVLVLGL